MSDVPAGGNTAVARDQTHLDSDVLAQTLETEKAQKEELIEQLLDENNN